jgi:hypothetical protein
VSSLLYKLTGRGCCNSEAHVLSARLRVPSGFLHTLFRGSSYKTGVDCQRSHLRGGT